VTVGLRTPLALATRQEITDLLLARGGRSALRSGRDRTIEVDHVLSTLQLMVEHTFTQPHSYSFTVQLHNKSTNRVDVTVFQSIFRTEFRINEGEGYLGYSGSSGGDADLWPPRTRVALDPLSSLGTNWWYTQTVEYSVRDGRVIAVRTTDKMRNGQGSCSGDIGGHFAPADLNERFWASASALVRVTYQGSTPLELWLRSEPHKYLRESPPLLASTEGKQHLEEKQAEQSVQHDALTRAR
jgi:hypothetical protein